MKMDTGDNILFTSRFPPLKSLECSIISHQAQVLGPQGIQMKCRELVRSDASILVLPTGDDFSAYIVGHVGYLRNGKLMAKLRQHSFQVTEEVKVEEQLLILSYVFTAKARLTPKWNMVAGWLVQGMGFLQGGRNRAVNIEGTMKNAQLTLSIQPVSLVTRQLQAEDLGVSLPTLRGFLSGCVDSLEETEMEGRRCVVLPNCTMAYVKSVSTGYSGVAALPTYNHLRVYWKKQHGYVIPETESLHYTVYFHRDPSTLMNYPGSCVLANPPHASRTREGRQIALTFIKDLLQRLPSVCGLSMAFEERTIPRPCLLKAGANASPLLSIQSVGSSNTHMREPGKVPPTASKSAAEFRKVNNSVVDTHEETSSTTPIIPKFTNSYHSMQKIPSKQPKPLANSTHQSNSSVPLTEASNVVSRPAASNVVSRPEASNVVSRPAASNVVSRPAASNVVSRPAASNVVSRSAASNVVSRPAASNVVSRPAASSTGDVSARVNDSRGPFHQVPTSTEAEDNDDFSLYSSPLHSAKTVKITDPLSPSKLKQITKVKVTDLKKWLWQEGVKFKAKGTKKDDLVKLVVERVRQTGNAFHLVQ